MINIAISGASGRMGITLIQAVLDNKELQLSAALDHPHSDFLNKDVAQILGRDKCGVNVVSEVSQCDFDVLIDFTRPEATMDYLDYCRAHGKSLVVGTTGFTNEQLAEFKKAAQSTKILLAANMSVGVNLSFKLIQMAAQAIGQDADIEILEAHHKHKVDAPSGTALAMGNVIAQELDRNLDQHGVFSRHGHTGERKSEQIGFSVIRAGDIVGDHTALFALDGERIEITHKASNRNIYANGALRATRWISDQEKPGLYDMQNVLGLA